MPGSFGSDQSSSSSLISSLRKFRFQNKAKPSPLGSNSPQSSHNSEVSRDSCSSSNSPQLSSTNSPLNYKKYDNSSGTQNILQSISAKIQILFKNSTKNPFLVLKLTAEESKKLRETVLQDAKVVEKWSSNVDELAASDSNEKVLRIKRLFLSHLSRNILDALNSRLPKNSAEQLNKKPPIRTYSRVKPAVEPAKTQASVVSIPQPSEGHNQGAMDDYEEFCEKEQSLRKLLDAFPGADIMEAQDILVKCQWDLNKSIQEAQNQPLRTTRKRSFPGTFVAPVPENLPNQRTMTSPHQRLENVNNNIPEEIVLDSSDDEELNGNASSQTSKSYTPSQVMPPKRARRLISTDSSEDEAAPQTPKSAVAPFNQKSQTVTISSVQQKIPAPSISPLDQASSSNQNNSSVDKTINIPQSLSIKPVTNKPSASTEQTNSSAAMPNLPKGLLITKVGGAENSNKAIEKEGGVSLNGNPNNIPPNLNNKSAHLVRIKPSNSIISTVHVTTTSTNSVITSKGVSITPVNQTFKIPSVGTAVSISAVNQTVTISSAPKTLSITPVGSSSKDPVSVKDTQSSSTEEESSLGTPKMPRKRIKNITSLKDPSDMDKESVGDLEGADKFVETDKNVKKRKLLNKIKTESKKAKTEGKKAKNIHEKQRKYLSDDDEDEEYGNEDIYDSEDSDCEENLTSAHCAVLKFFQEASAEELGSIPGCSKKKIEAVINLRPFSKWIELVEKLKNDKALSTDLLNGAKKVLDMRNAITKLMAKCQRISLDMEDLVENLKEEKESSSGYVGKQPELLNERMHLTPYQMLGLNWLLLMHNQQVNAILADEMGLGKTVQAISFLAYLKQINVLGPHLIVAPSSTLDNWKKELETWWPSVSLICYHGQQEARRELRMQILNDEVDEFDVMITTYNMVTSCAEDRSFFKRLDFHYVVFDEAHMLKNMSSQRYTSLMRIKAPRRLLLTGTPLQNNLVELMSLLIFAMPNMFSGKIEQIKQMFTCVSKTDGNKNSYEKDRIDHAKRIMKPFVLRRLKKDVLKELPLKHDETRFCPMVQDQAVKYEELVKKFSAEVQVNTNEEKSSSGGMMMMQLRRAANHPLLLRRFFDDEKLLEMSQKMLQEPTHCESDPNIIFEDMAVMSDFELHRLCKQFKSIKSFALPDSTVLNSGKFKVLDELIPGLIKEDHRILLFSQFTMVLDIVQDYMTIKKYKFLRLDGQTPVGDRQQLIDEFNNDPGILVFLLSTKAGGLGINLTAADTVIIHDIDFNPYNDKQAEDRCHRVGQVKDVKVIRLISENSIEEGILQRAKEKLKLERDIHEEDDSEENDTASVVMLLRDALGLKPKS